VLSAGCNGLIDGGLYGSNHSGAGLDAGSPAEQIAINDWKTEAEPALVHAGCVGCHGGAGEDSAPLFLGGSSVEAMRTTLLGFHTPLVNFTTPDTSQLLNEGQHAGPPIDPTDAAQVLNWIGAEAAAASTSGTLLLAGPSTLKYCASGTAPGDCPPATLNTLNMTSLVAGAQVTFVAYQLTDSIEIANLTLVAGPPGVFIEHPLFVSVDPTGTPTDDAVDRFSALQLDVPANGSAAIAGSIEEFNFPPTNQLEIAFQVVTPYKVMSGGGGSTLGCKALSSFVTNVIPVMGSNVGTETESCYTCHGGSGSSTTVMNAKNAMNLTNMDDGQSADQMTACGYVLPMLTLTGGSAAANSQLFVEPSGSDPDHPFKFANANDDQTFVTAVEIWAIAEAAAQ
jgi:hypothetical protein